MNTILRSSGDVARVVMYDRKTIVDIPKPDAGPFHLAQVIRGNGPREGESMGWAVLTIGDDSSASVTMVARREAAVASLRRRRSHHAAFDHVETSSKAPLEPRP